MKVKKNGDRFLTSLTESGFTTTYIREREREKLREGVRERVNTSVFDQAKT
jgi:hypothetical protein